MSEDIYIRDNIPSFEALYGKGLISLGGQEAILKMFEGETLEGKSLLDIGFGLGGMAHFLADKFSVQVFGVEVPSWMADYALESAPEEIRNKLSFFTYDEQGKIPLPSESIDLVYSKGVLTNVKNKTELFQEIQRVLKPLGRLCFIDWLLPEEETPKKTELPLGQTTHKENPRSYENLLEKAGFEKLEFKNVSSEYLGYVEKMDFFLRSPEHQAIYADVITKDFRKDLIHFNLDLKQKIMDKTQLSYRIRGQKKS